MMMKKTHNTKGFTLLELLLTIGLLGLMMAGVYELFDGWLQRAVNRTAAADMLRVQQASEEYTLANFGTFSADVPGVFTEIAIADLRNQNYLPTGYQPRNAFKQDIRVFRRNLRVPRLNKDGTNAVDASGAPIFITTIEVVTVSEDPAGGLQRIPNQRLLDAAQAGGPKMGIISENVLPGTNYSGRISSVYSEWYINRADLGPAGYNATPDAQGGYLASYGLVNSEKTEANDDWLYRVVVEGRPELNRMATDLRMNANELQSTGNVIADRITVVGNAAFRGVTSGTTSESAQALSVDQALRIDGNGESRFNMKDTSGGCTFADAGGGNRTLAGTNCDITGGEIQIISPNNDAITNIGTLTADGSIITDYTDVDNTTDIAGSAIFETVSGNDMIASSSVVAPTTNVVQNVIETSQLQTADMSITNNATINNQLAAASFQPSNTQSVTADLMQVGNAVEVTGNIIANQINATDSIYIANATGSYYDAGVNRNVTCTTVGTRTYCEPIGTTFWNGNAFREDCSYGPGGNQYQCFHYRWVGFWEYYGYCRHTRSVGASGQAYHASSCL